MIQDYINLKCCCHSFLYIFAVALTIFNFLYLCFGISLLVTEKDTIHENCRLWWYILYSLVASFVFQCFCPRNTISAGCWVFLHTGLLVFGSYELWTSVCHSHYGTNFWTFGVLTFVLQCIGMALMFIYYCLPKKRRQETFNICDNV